MNNYITTDWLNLRNEPVVKKGNVIGIMPPDTTVEEVDKADGWLKVKWNTGRIFIEGYASEKYLQATDVIVPPPEVIPRIAQAHLKTNKVIMRGNVNGRAYPLNEPGLFKGDLNTANETDRKNAIHNVINYLDVEHSARVYYHLIQ